MLWQFKVKNYKTFKDESTLSLIASNYDKQTREDENVYFDSVFNVRVLKCAVVYGANASGKTNLLDAIAFMRGFVLKSSRGQLGDKTGVDPFRLNTVTEKQPSEFEVIFTSKNILYRYGFELSNDEVISEWLFFKPKSREIELFYRDGDKIDFHENYFKKGRVVVNEGLLRNNALLISVAAQFNEEQAISIIEWFKNVRLVSSLRGYLYQRDTIDRTESPDGKKKIIALLKDADLGIQDVEVEFMSEDKIPENYPLEYRKQLIKEIKEGKNRHITDILLSHRKFGENNEFVENVSFSLEKDESAGTQKYFNMLGPILNVIENGQVLVVDELDAQLHPKLVCRIISLFNSKDINKKNAQLIFNTHDTNLLKSNLFRRDQIWFTEKDKYSASNLYSLSDFSSETVRKDEAFERNYMKGKYGAVPYFESLDMLNEVFTAYESREKK